MELTTQNIYPMFLYISLQHIHQLIAVCNPKTNTPISLMYSTFVIRSNTKITQLHTEQWLRIHSSWCTPSNLPYHTVYNESMLLKCPWATVWTPERVCTSSHRSGLTQAIKLLGYADKNIVVSYIQKMGLNQLVVINKGWRLLKTFEIVYRKTKKKREDLS